MGQAFQKHLKEQDVKYYNVSFRYPINKGLLRDIILDNRITHVINCAGYTGKPNVDTCEVEKDKCLFANVYFPKTVAEICNLYGVPFTHVSSGCIYNDVNCEQGLPPIIEYPEHFKPNFSFDNGGCSWYSGTKALGEQLIMQANYESLICRLRIPFNGEVNKRNFINKIINYPILLNATNSFSQLDEFVEGCLYLAKTGRDGIYNMTQPGYITTKDVVELLEKHGLTKDKEYFKSIDHFNRTVRAPRSNCVLDSSAAIRSGVKLTPIKQSMEQAIKQYAANITK